MQIKTQIQQVAPLELLEFFIQVSVPSMNDSRTIKIGDNKEGFVIYGYNSIKNELIGRLNKLEKLEEIALYFHKVMRDKKKQFLNEREFVCSINNYLKL